MIAIAIVIQQLPNGVVQSHITSDSQLPTAGELKMLQSYHQLLTDGAAAEAAKQKRTMVLVDKSTLTFGPK